MMKCLIDLCTHDSSVCASYVHMRSYRCAQNSINISDQLLFKTLITTLQIYHNYLLLGWYRRNICNVVRGSYWSLHLRVALLFIKYALFSGIKRKIGSLALLQLIYFCSLVCREKPQTNFKSSYWQNINGTLFNQHMLMSDLVTWRSKQTTAEIVYKIPLLARALGLKAAAKRARW